MSVNTNSPDKPMQVVQGDGYEVVIERSSRRKTVALKVDGDVVTLVAPRQLPIERIEQLVADKHGWIVEKLAHSALATPSCSNQFVSGEAYPYLGRNYRLKVLTGDLIAPKLVNGRITVTVPAPKQQAHYIRRLLQSWYKRNADRKIREKVRRYRKLVGVETGVVRIKDFKSRWGSCTPYGDLEFNWVIVMAPNRVVDYVVVHELCHLLRHDHSTQFWKEVERVMPDYKEHREWLKDNSQKLAV